MPFDDPRDFMDYLEKRGELIRVSREVEIKYEIAAYIRKTSDQQGPAILFENVKGFDMRVLGGLYATRNRALLALQTSKEEIFEKFRYGVEHPIPPRLVDDGPCKEVVLKGEDIDLMKLPIPTYCEKDGGPFITHGVQISKDPETRTKNAAIYRMQLKGKKKLNVWANTFQHLALQYSKAEARNEPLEIAVALGVDPAVMLASQVAAPYGQDEIEIAGGLRGKPVDVVKCETVDLEIPATSEIVIEGVMPPGVRELEGPFGEFTGYYGGQAPNPIVKVTAITMRKGAIFHAGLTGLPITENHVLKELPNEVSLYHELKWKFPEVTGVHYSPAGGTEFMVFVSMRPRYKGQARNVVLAVLGSMKRPKYVIVCDDDVDIYDHVKVLWAVATRSQPDQDVIIVPGIAAGPLDPSVPETNVTAVMGIDATRPFGEPFPEVTYVPGVEKVPDLG